MAHRGRPYPFADGRDLWIQPWPNRPNPIQFACADFAATGVYAYEYLGTMDLSTECTFDPTLSIQRWEFEPNYPANKTKFAIEWGGTRQLIVAGKFNCQIAVNGVWGSKSALEFIPNFLGGREMVGSFAYITAGIVQLRMTVLRLAAVVY